MVNNAAQRKYENVVVPVDLSEASAHALRVAQSTGLVASERATVLHAFAALATGKMFQAGYDKKRIESYIASERRLAGEELAVFLSTNNLGERWPVRLEEGTPMETIARVVSDMRPDLVVMGTHSRSALLKALIGSVTEEALRSLSVDILAVPPRK
jgi:universal stress protein E